MRVARRGRADGGYAGGKCVHGQGVIARRRERRTGSGEQRVGSGHRDWKTACCGGWARQRSACETQPAGQRAGQRVIKRPSAAACGESLAVRDAKGGRQCTGWGRERQGGRGDGQGECSTAGLAVGVGRGDGDVERAHLVSGARKHATG